MSATNYLELKILDHTLGTAAYTMPTGVYVKLHTGAPGEDATANVATEATRKAATFNAASGGSAALAATVSWTNVSTTETYTHVSLWDAVSAGNPLYWAALTASVAVTAGDNFDLTALTISAD